MKKILKKQLFLLFSLIFFLISGCGNVPVKKYYILNYEPDPLRYREYDKPYPYTIRVKEFEIEKAYDRPQLVYKKSPFELQYYFYQIWAVTPTRMISDVIHKHLQSTGIVSHVVRRFDEGRVPDYELSGTIEAIEEYDSEEIWFAHISIRIVLTRTKDNRLIYSRHFDRRKKVLQHKPEYVIRVLSQIVDFIMTQAIHDIDVKLAEEYGVGSSKNKMFFEPVPDKDTLTDKAGIQDE